MTNDVIDFIELVITTFENQEEFVVGDCPNYENDMFNKAHNQLMRLYQSNVNRHERRRRAKET